MFPKYTPSAFGTSPKSKSDLGEDLFMERLGLIISALGGWWVEGEGLYTGNQAWE